MPSPVRELQRVGDRIFLNLRFGFGLNSAAERDNPDAQECIDGENFDLDLDKESFRNRKAFDLIATATNGQEIRGFVELIKADGTVTNLIQAGGQVYNWDGGRSFTAIGTVKGSLRIRGGRHSRSIRIEKVIASDVDKKSVIKHVDGATFEKGCMYKC